MDAVLTWLSDNRDPLISGVVIVVVSGMVLGLGNWGRKTLGRRLWAWFRTRTEDRRVAKEQAKGAMESRTARQRREQERRRCEARFHDSDIAKSSNRPQTRAGQVIVGSLLGDRSGKRWELQTEEAFSGGVDLWFMIPFSSSNETIAPGWRAARKFNTEADVAIRTPGRYVH